MIKGELNMKCFIKTCGNDADYLIESNTPYTLFGIIKYYLHMNKRPICNDCLPYISWDFNLYTLNNKSIL